MESISVNKNYETCFSKCCLANIFLIPPPSQCQWLQLFSQSQHSKTDYWEENNMIH